MNRAWSLSKPPFEAIARHLKTCRGQRCRHPVQLRGRGAAAPVCSTFHRGQLIKKEEDREQKVAQPHSTVQEILDACAFWADRVGAGPCRRLTSSDVTARYVNTSSASMPRQAHLNCAPLWRKRSRLSQLLHLNADAS